jgi:hypothetical protein
LSVEPKKVLVSLRHLAIGVQQVSVGDELSSDGVRHLSVGGEVSSDGLQHVSVGDGMSSVCVQHLSVGRRFLSDEEELSSDAMEVSSTGERP